MRLHDARVYGFAALTNMKRSAYPSPVWSTNPGSDCDQPLMTDAETEYGLEDVVASYIGLISLATISIYCGSFGSLPVSVQYHQFASDDGLPTPLLEAKAANRKHWCGKGRGRRGGAIFRRNTTRGRLLVPSPGLSGTLRPLFINQICQHILDQHIYSMVLLCCDRSVHLERMCISFIHT